MLTVCAVRTMHPKKDLGKGLVNNLRKLAELTRHSREGGNLFAGTAASAYVSASWIKHRPEEIGTRQLPGHCGSNENTNGLPRQTLDWRTPEELMAEKEEADSRNANQERQMPQAEGKKLMRSGLTGSSLRNC